MDTPAGVVEDLLIYFSASHRAESELNKSAMNSGSSGDSSVPAHQKAEVSAPKGLNPNKSQYKGFEIREGGQRMTPPPPSAFKNPHRT